MLSDVSKVISFSIISMFPLIDSEYANANIYNTTFRDRNPSILETIDMEKNVNEMYVTCNIKSRIYIQNHYFTFLKGTVMGIA